MDGHLGSLHPLTVVHTAAVTMYVRANMCLSSGFHGMRTLFLFLKIETGSHNVAQTGLKVPSSSDAPALASQCVGISGMSHCAWANFCILFIFYYFFETESHSVT